MTITAEQRLKAMGLQRWQLRHPHFYPDYQQPVINLPDEVVLLFVSDATLNEHDAWLFGRILASMKLEPEQARQLTSDGALQLGEHQLQWVWFAGCEGNAPTGVNVLSSIPLAEMHQQPNAKKQLWQQICSYDS
ncbi:DNA polymerase III subunit psi [Thaumasiovibrio subtropicus]|uniref:DNA polymerase III subunit psi n=1 Tax=Thaumasiovibrio subtropicus TaxID=1891207 RepID=UPI000B34BABE|nr:DNA polymerase III subunit psi [Thaumasiovibrio subtropicus]